MRRDFKNDAFVIGGLAIGTILLFVGTVTSSPIVSAIAVGIGCIALVVKFTVGRDRRKQTVSAPDTPRRRTNDRENEHRNVPVAH